MCGRYALTQSPSAYADWFGVDAIKTEALEPNYNVAPTDPVYAVAEYDDERQLGVFRWGLLPWFSKDRRQAARHINARIETVAQKASFKDSFATKRCLIPADGFYEWERLGEDKGKLPHFIHADDDGPIAFAGLWATWKDPETEEKVRTCTILTGPPDATVKPLHDRMPVILEPALWDGWLDLDLQDPDQVHKLLAGRKAVPLAEHAVSTLVNSVKNNLPELIEPLRG
ncbi:MAG: SOS response-associated peptidase [Acidimicrobiia bacterium]|nr:SOS response-associated peptidase [Acidimicrobiia bacterium]MDH3470761.1 SOS response-associated peptidase [Acidimicrobiia bacterium]